MKNESQKWLLLSADGKTVVEGESHPDGRIVLAAPGGWVDEDWIKKYDLADRLKAPAPAPAVEAKMVPAATVENKMVAPTKAENKASSPVPNPNPPRP